QGVVGGKPALVTKLKGNAIVAQRGQIKKGVEAVEVCLEVRRKLKEQNTELFRGIGMCEGAGEGIDQRAAVAQTLDVGDNLRRFEAETELVRHRGDQTSDHGVGG